MKRWARFLMIFLLACGMRMAGADHWDSFDAASVKSFGCSIDQVNLQVVGGQSIAQWDFTGWAKRDLPPPMDEWRMSLGMYPPTARGRRRAMLDCQTWMTEAEKRIRQAQKGAKVERK